MKSLDFFFNSSCRSLHFWELVRQEYSPFLGRPKTWICKALAWNRLEGLRGCPKKEGLRGRRKILEIKRLKRPNTYIFVQFQLRKAF